MSDTSLHEILMVGDTWHKQADRKIESLRQQLAECQATNGKLREYFVGITKVSGSSPVDVYQSMEGIARKALALPNDATALNELIEERTASLTAENTNLLAANRDCIDHFNALKVDYDELTAEVERLKSESAAFASNLRGKHATTGATYQHLIQQNAELTAQRDAAMNALIHIQQVACSGSPELGIASEAIDATIANCKEQK